MEERTSSEKRFALLIDADNVSAKYIKPILDELSKYGTVTYKRIYGDWTLSLHAKWKDSLLENSITPIQQFGYTQGKNATDSAMIIDAMDILYTNSVEGFCIVSSDSDFTRLASRIRESGLTVIGMGEKKTPVPFRKACDIFTTLELLLPNAHAKSSRNKARASQTEPAAPGTGPSIEDVEQAIITIVTENQNTGKGTGLGEVGSRLQKRFPDFDVRSYGTNLLSKLFEEFDSVCINKVGNNLEVTLTEIGEAHAKNLAQQESGEAKGGAKAAEAAEAPRAAEARDETVSGRRVPRKRHANVLHNEERSGTGADEEATPHPGESAEAAQQAGAAEKAAPAVAAEEADGAAADDKHSEAAGTGDAPAPKKRSTHRGKRGGAKHRKAAQKAAAAARAEGGESAEAAEAADTTVAEVAIAAAGTAEQTAGAAEAAAETETPDQAAGTAEADAAGAGSATAAAETAATETAGAETPDQAAGTAEADAAGAEAATTAADTTAEATPAAADTAASAPAEAEVAAGSDEAPANAPEPQEPQQDGPAAKPKRKRSARSKDHAEEQAEPKEDAAADMRPGRSTRRRAAVKTSQSPDAEAIERALRTITHDAGPDGILAAEAARQLRGQFKDFRVHDLGFGRLHSYAASLPGFTIEKQGRDYILRVK
ncbi:NYN domain-containing protein [Xiamenia xianingshaonis]|uniref:NYN domain-containing protein n=1 Tax=Xiamenia xianingshaonis TaxID=2682776 RepID=A0A9E6MP56_9ACTN|nr:NYN domain-containing protein [Xiamenia xianingshaonis]QTU83748.1 NYN domain-containing protein [Xiamenia xianingshaonis]